MHCAIVWLLPGALTALGLGVLLGHEAEWIMTALAVGFAATALVVSWRHRRSARIVTLLGVGIAGIFFSRFLEEQGFELWGTVVGVASGAVLVAGHIIGLRMGRRRVDDAS